jgi:hypothetical protein
MSGLWLPRALGSLCLALAVAGCSTASKEGAARGAKSGAVGGLVAGAVGSIFWGGDAVNNALRTAAVGAASGAAVGAMNGAERDKRQGSPPPPAPPPAPAATGGLSAADQQLKTQMGDLNFAAGEELARCRHVGAISRAEKAFASETDPKRRNYALLIQAMSAEESGNTAKASAVYAQWGQFDPARRDVAKMRNEALEGLLKVQKIRQDTGLPPLCT